jgi:hypothetical protein
MSLAVGAQDSTGGEAAAGQAAADEPEGVVETLAAATEAAAEGGAEVVDAARDTGAAAATAVGDAVGGAVSTTADAVTSGTVAVVDQGRAAWMDYVMPLWERFVEVLPGALKAFTILFAFWLFAVFASRSVAWLLGKTDLDQKLVRDWGLSGLFESKDRTVESTAGTLVKWLIMLFGFVAFFDALNLNMVAGPLQNILNQVSSAVPRLLKAGIVLLVFWAVGSILRMAVSKGLTAMSFDEKAKRFIASREIKGEKVGPSDQVGRLVFYLVLLFGLAPFLDALGQQAIVTPLRDMIGKVMAFFPNLVAALILLLIGKIVATIVREIVSNFLAATPIDGFADKYGFGGSDSSRKLSDMVGSVAFFFTFIPIIGAAVDSLKIDALSGPVKSTLDQVMNTIPLIFVAVVILAIGYFIAKAIRGLLEGFLEGVGFDELPGKLGLSFLSPKEGQPALSHLAGTVVMAVILLLTANQALATLGFHELAEMVGTLLGYLPSLLVGLAIIVAALSLGSYVSGLISSMMVGSQHAVVVSNIAKFAIIFLGFSMGFSQLGVGEEIVQTAVAAVLGGAALALGIAFGLGGKERAQQFLDSKKED